MYHGKPLTFYQVLWPAANANDREGMTSASQASAGNQIVCDLRGRCVGTTGNPYSTRLQVFRKQAHVKWSIGNIKESHPVDPISIQRNNANGSKVYASVCEGDAGVFMRRLKHVTQGSRAIIC
jgi:hypothetical protein